MYDYIEYIKIFLAGVETFFIIYLVVYSTFLFAAAVAGAVTLYRNRYYATMRNEITSEYYMPITIIIPAYNEESTVIETVESLMFLDYRLYEIVIVNDGSTDNTAQVVVDHFGMTEVDRPIRRQIPCKPELSIYESKRHKAPITLVNKENGGKADALNMGINVSQFPYFICLDADCVLQRDSLEFIMRPILESDKTVACGGLVRLSNGVKLAKGDVVKYTLPNNVLASMQVLEYDRSFLASRILLDYFNGNLIISGAFGLFRKEEVLTIGGYDAGTIGEDFELVMKLHSFLRQHNVDYDIKYVPDAVCWTQAPNKLKNLMKQRRRWFLGLFQGLTKYRYMFFNHQYGLLGFASYLYYLIYELLAPFIELFGLLAMLVAFYFDLLNIPFMITFFLIYTVFGGILSLTTFLARVHVRKLKLRFVDFLKAVLVAFLEISVLRMVLNFSRWTAFWGYKRKKNAWDKFERNAGSVMEETDDGPGAGAGGAKPGGKGPKKKKRRPSS